MFLILNIISIKFNSYNIGAIAQVWGISFASYINRVVIGSLLLSQLCSLLVMMTGGELESCGKTDDQGHQQ
jgi:hypothetical protein